MNSRLIKNYNNNFLKLATIDHEVEKKIILTIKKLKIIKNNKKKVIIVGNGGSAAIASHFSVDMTKNGEIRCINFNESDLLTCFSNDYGYQNSFKEIIKSQINKNDLCVFISCSGESKNVVNAAKYCAKIGIRFVSFTGFDKNNSLKKISNISYYVDSNNYNVVETVHQTALLSIVESLSI